MTFSSAFLDLISLCLWLSSEVIRQREGKRKSPNAEVIREMFTQVPMFYASHAFWFWDDTLHDESFAALMEMGKPTLNPRHAHPRNSMDRSNHKYPSLPYEHYLKNPWFNNFHNALNTVPDSFWFKRL